MRFSTQQEMLDYARDILARVQPTMPKLFKRLPKMAVNIRPIPPIAKRQRRRIMRPAPRTVLVRRGST